MLFVLASWASMLLAVVLSWLWLQSLRPPGQGADVACAECHVRATRMTLRSIILLAALSTALLLLHFLLPAREARDDAEWAAHGSRNSTFAL